MIEVTLDKYEIEVAAGVGTRRMVDSLVNGRKQAAGDKDPTGATAGWQQHIEGACGEMAFAKALGRYWSGSVNTFKDGGDVGDVQIRTRSRHDYDLIVRDRDRDEDYFILVTGLCPAYRVVGYIRGADAKQRKWQQNHGGHGGAFFIPAVELKPLEKPRAR